ncbi:hypothetical protein H5410_027317 [Solanum commersonii]|uniref:Uncharacterized protein n=1 Tax=Solanum commersonii TaxID=4109 RepID=A0A9J5YYW3_SOLCO|nr:hypothetical protein H5410_027317 [Solanum commersonii]
MIGDFNFKIRDEDFKRRIELGTEMKNMNKGEQGQQGGDHKQIKTREQEEQQQQNTKDGGSTQQPEQKNTEDSVETNLTTEPSVKGATTNHNLSNRYS